MQNNVVRAFANIYFEAFEGSSFAAHAHYNCCSLDSAEELYTQLQAASIRQYEQDAINGFMYYIIEELGCYYGASAALVEEYEERTSISSKTKTLESLVAFTTAFITQHKDSKHELIQMLQEDIGNMHVAACLFKEFK